MEQMKLNILKDLDSLEMKNNNLESGKITGYTIYNQEQKRRQRQIIYQVCILNYLMRNLI